MFHLTRRITTIERLDPDNRRRPGRSPMMPPRLHRHTTCGHILGRRLNGHVLHRSFEIPNLRAAREKLGGRLIGIRRMNPLHQHIPAKGRHIKAAEDRRPPQFFLPACLHLQQNQLGGQIVIKQFFIMIILQQIGISQHGRLLGACLLHHRPNRSPGRRGWIAALARNGLAN